MVGQQHRLDRQEFEQALGVGDGQRSLVGYSPWDCTESDTTERLHLTSPWALFGIAFLWDWNEN